jgi:elongation factor P
MIETSDFKKGAKLLIDGQPYVITDFQHVKPGKGNQFTRTKLRNMITGQNLERTIKSGEKFDVPDVVATTANFLYKDDAGFHFMNGQSFEQVTLFDQDIGDAKNYLIENLECTLLFFNGKPIGVDIPNTVTMTVKATEPGFKGNTATNTFKPATVETGYVIQVPLHISVGDRLKIDTRTGEYLSKAN